MVAEMAAILVAQLSRVMGGLEPAPQALPMIL